MSWRIPFNRPAPVGREAEYLAAAMRSSHWSGDGEWTRRCHSFIEEQVGVGKCLLTTSCTHALEMSALLLDLKSGDEVIVPAFTFATSVNAFVVHGARPVFVDVRPDTLNIDERLIEAAITPRTRAIVVVHYAGVGCAMETISEIASRHGLPVIEDNAHGLFGLYRDRNLGTFGSVATLSFHETKNFSRGEGGAILINDHDWIARAEIIREKGTDRSRFFRGQVDKYTWVDKGSSYLPSELLAAVLFAQFEQKDTIQARRRRIWETYETGLAEWASRSGVRLPVIPAECDQAYHLFYLLLPSLEARSAPIEHLKARGILSVFHYLPLHLSPMGRLFGGRDGGCPVSEDVSDRLLRLPLFNTMTDEDSAEVISAILEFGIH